MKLGVQHDLGLAPALFTGLGPQTARATASALTTVARRAQFDIVVAMRQAFDRPTPYALNGLRVEAATAGRLQASVAIKGKPDAYGGAVPAESFLRAEILGGSRAWKRSERALQRIGVLPASWFAIPAKGARLDAYGNLSRGQVIEILSWFQAFPTTTGYRANSTAATRAKKAKGTKRRAGYEYFAVQPGVRGLRPGIYQRVSFGAGKGVRPVLVFVSKVAYRKRFDFYGVIDQSVRRNLDVQMQAELRREIGG